MLSLASAPTCFLRVSLAAWTHGEQRSQEGLVPQTAPGGLRPPPPLRACVASFQMAAHGRQEAFHLANPGLVLWVLVGLWSPGSFPLMAKWG